MHNGFLQVEGQKMSKSLGNFFTIHELMATEKFGRRKWPGEVLRLAMLMTHYREPIDFSVRRLEEAETVLTRLWRRAAETTNRGEYGAVFAAMSDDLNTLEAIRALGELSGMPLRQALIALGFPPQAPTGDIDIEEVQATIDQRLAFISDRNWAEADRIRDELLAQGIQLKDGKDAKTAERVTTWEVKR
jgi:cysteinyl-tRNA synthetase